MGRFDDRFVYMCVRKRVSVTVCVSVSPRVIVSLSLRAHVPASMCVCTPVSSSLFHIFVIGLCGCGWWCALQCEWRRPRFCEHQDRDSRMLPPSVAAPPPLSLGEM